MFSLSSPPLLTCQMRTKIAVIWVKGLLPWINSSHFEYGLLTHLASPRSHKYHASSSAEIRAFHKRVIYKIITNDGHGGLSDKSIVNSDAITAYLETDPVLADVGTLNARRLCLHSSWSFSCQTRLQMGTPRERNDQICTYKSAGEYVGKVARYVLAWLTQPNPCI